MVLGLFMVPLHLRATTPLNRHFIQVVTPSTATSNPTASTVPNKNKPKSKLESIIDETENNNKLNLNLAISYGSKQEIVNAIREVSNKVKNNIISVRNIDENIINEHLYTRNLPNVDLLIRTGGEKRVSNFLLWQIAYAEMYFTDILWPDFKKEDFLHALQDYQKRERRFGKII